jgi:hypothetical protein
MARAANPVPHANTYRTLCPVTPWRASIAVRTGTNASELALNCFGYCMKRQRPAASIVPKALSSNFV